jgi:hypothetical protein
LPKKKKVLGIEIGKFAPMFEARHNV